MRGIIAENKNYPFPYYLRDSFSLPLFIASGM